MGRRKKINKGKLLYFLPDKLYIELKYFYHFKKFPNLKNPATFNEKIQWLKLYDRKALYTMLVDKYEAKQYVADKIGREYVVPLFGVWDKFEDIDFDKLPDKFVLKTTHDCGGIVICDEKAHFEKDSAKRNIETHLNYNYYYEGREWPYKGVKPRIIAEKYLEDMAQTSEIIDYKLMCFNGKVRCSFTCTERLSGDMKVTFFDREWNIMPFERHYPKSKYEISKPGRYDEMIFLAEKLAKDIAFVRVDFYEVGGKLYVGELTLYPGSGWEEFTPAEYDEMLGSWLILPER